jgi:hypothetical protein
MTKARMKESAVNARAHIKHRPKMVTLREEIAGAIWACGNV